MALLTLGDLNPALWLDAADLSTQFSASSGGSTISPGDSAFRVEDKGSGGFNFIQEGSLNVPTLAANSFGTLPAWNFGANSDTRLASATYNLESAKTKLLRILVVDCQSFVNNISFRSAASTIWIQAFSNDFIVYVGGSNGRTGTQATGKRVITIAIDLAAGPSVSNGIKLYQNGTQVTFATTASTLPASTESADSATIGNVINPASNLAWVGRIAEVGLILGDTTDETRQTAEGIVAWKWGLETLLPNDHPYKDAAPGAGGNAIDRRKRLLQMRGWR
jgi:hypothetical protein